MKTKSILRPLAALLPMLLTHFALSQGTAFNYQGRLNDGSIAATGLYDLRFAIYDLGTGGSLVAGAITRSTVPVSNGLFSVTLDFGVGVFTGAGRWLEIAVRTNGAASFTTLNPRQSLTPAPYAITAGTVTGIVPSSSLVGSYPGAVTFNNAANQFSGDGSGLRFGGFGFTNLPSYWKLTGNAGTAPGANFVGTTDNQPLELSVNRQRALRLEPTTNSPNLIGGFAGNYVEAGIVGASISGGGTVNATNQILHGGNTFHGVFNFPAHFATIAGGTGNSISGNRYASIGGGANNQIEDSWGLGVDLATISGGSANKIDMAPGSTIAGGVVNRIIGDNGDFVVESTIGGGNGNIIETVTDRIFQSTIAGGLSNGVYKASHATIGGGRHNSISVYADHATLAGGAENGIGALSAGATISGGVSNIIASRSDGAAIAGGVNNAIDGQAGGASIGGGSGNRVAGSPKHSAIGGGRENWIIGSDVVAVAHDTIAGGLSNEVRGADRSVIGGGGFNRINGDVEGNLIFGSTIAGGEKNLIDTWEENVYRMTIGGGGSNTIQKADDATICGGRSNLIGPFAQGATIGGGMKNATDALASTATISGGANNTAGTYAKGAAIGGGEENRILSTEVHTEYGTISGGRSNLVNGSYGIVAGGRNNLATNNAFAAGSRAKAVHPGAFVWAAGNTNDFPSFSENRVHFYASGGLEMEYGGQLANGRGNKWIVLGSQAANRVISVYNGAYLSEGGAWTDTSDRNAKENFEPVDPCAILDGVMALPVTRWNYRSETNSVRHLGAVAQDFHRTFGLGADDKHIAGLDGVGVALAAIQGLNQKLEAREAEIEQLRKRLEALENSMASRSQR